MTIPSTGATDTVTIPVNIATCVDCFNITNGPARLDLCGVCNGTNSTCNGCDGVPASGKVYDVCNVCGGDGLSCINITTNAPSVVNCTSQIIFTMFHTPTPPAVTWSIITLPIVGFAYVNPTSGVVIWNNPAYVGVVWFVVKATSKLNSTVTATYNVSFDVVNCSDCSGTQLGTQLLDVCGVCGGNGKSCLDCFGVPNGNGVLDACGVCNGTSVDCPNGGGMSTWFLYLLIIVITVASVWLFWNFLKVLIGETTFIGGVAPIIPNIPEDRMYVPTQPELLPSMTPTSTVVRRMHPHNKAVDLYPGTVTIPISSDSLKDNIGDSIQRPRYDTDSFTV